MPNIDADAKAWEMTVAQRVGETVQRRRDALRLTAVQLAKRTEGLGYPITRVAISKIENNSRSGKLDIAEWLILAAALDVSPIQLLFPGIPDERVEMLPGVDRASISAATWVSGGLSDVDGWSTLPDGTSLDRNAQQVIDWAREREALRARVARFEKMKTETEDAETIESISREITRDLGRIRGLNEWLHGRGAPVDDPRFTDNA